MPSIVPSAAVVSAAPPAAVVAGAADPSAPGISASIEGGSAGFAALLLGQMAAELNAFGKTAGQALGTSQEGDIADAESLATDASATPTDPALILASIGLAPLPADAAAAGTPRDNDLAAAILQGKEGRAAGAASLLPDTHGRSAAPGSDAAEAALSAQTPVGTAANEQAGLTTSASLPAATEPAKLAGFEQKLAEATTAASATGDTAAAAAHAPAQQPAAHRSVETARIDTPLRQESWPAEFGQKVVWLATHDKQTAQITLNPPDLGPIEISLNLKNDQAQAVFSSPHAEVREAIETAIPRLREMFAGVGIDLGQANVNAESFRQAQEGIQERQQGSGNARSNDSRDGSGTAGTVAVTRQAAGISGRGLVDTFA